MARPSQRPTRADLLRKIQELEALQAGILHFADIQLAKADDRLTGSAVIVRLATLGGSEITAPFAIRDGLSQETITALRRDIARSYRLAALFKPRDPDEQKSPT